MSLCGWLMGGEALSSDRERLEKALGHRFERAELLQRALTHPSYVNEHSYDELGHNQRLEFLGDAVLDFVVGEWVFTQFASFDEGPLTRLRAALVRTETLARLANDIGLGPALRLGRGEQASGGRSRPANLCDAFEAVVGALYLDAGLAAVKRFLGPRIAEATQEIVAAESTIDDKSRLQERCQAEMGVTPRYRIVSEQGPDHRKMFVAEALVGGAVLGRGSGPSKQAAEQSAARSARHSLDNEVRAG
jgi:ribonuclease-3